MQMSFFYAESQTLNFNTFTLFIMYQNKNEMSAHDVIYSFVSSFIALFPVINPIGSGFIVNGFLQGLDDESQLRAVSKKIFTNILLIGIGSLVIGHFILLLFGLAVPVIQLGGGILICTTAFGWLTGSDSKATDKANQTMKKVNLEEIEKSLFYPISFPIGLGPGSISVIFTLMATADVKGDLLVTGVNYSVIALSIVAMAGILYVFLLQGRKIMKKLGASGSLIINKLVAFLTFCIGIQIIVTGISKIFHIDIL